MKLHYLVIRSVESRQSINSLSATTLLGNFTQGERH